MPWRSWPDRKAFSQNEGETIFDLLNICENPDQCDQIHHLGAC